MQGTLTLGIPDGKEGLTARRRRRGIEEEGSTRAPIVDVAENRKQDSRRGIGEGGIKTAPVFEQR